MWGIRMTSLIHQKKTLRGRNYDELKNAGDRRQLIGHIYSKHALINFESIFLNDLDFHLISGARLISPSCQEQLVPINLKIVQANKSIAQFFLNDAITITIMIKRGMRLNCA